MHRLGTLVAGLAALAGCLGEKTKPCNNGATCPFDEECTELPLDSPRLCGPPRLVEQCRDQPEYTTCDLQGTADGSCRSGVCSECTVNTAGCVFPGWTAMTSNTVANLRGVWVVDIDEAYAVGSARTVLRYDGLEWHVSTLDGTSIGDNADLNAVWGDRANLFVTSSDGKIVRGSFSEGAFSWRDEASVSLPLFGIGGSSPDDVVAVGLDEDMFGAKGTILEFDGIAWSAATLPTRLGSLEGVWVVDPQTAWVVGSQGVILQRTNDGSWMVSRQPGATESSLFSVWADADDAWAVGAPAPAGLDPPHPLVLHFASNAWSRSPNLEGESGVDLRSVWIDEQVFSVGRTGIILRQLPGSADWIADTVGTLDLEAVRGSSPRNVIAVGLGGTILRYTGF